MVLEPYVPSETFVPLARIKTPSKSGGARKEEQVRIKALIENLKITLLAVSRCGFEANPY